MRWQLKVISWKQKDFIVVATFIMEVYRDNEEGCVERGNEGDLEVQFFWSVLELLASWYSVGYGLK